jgi:hypothetical protein
MRVYEWKNDKGEIAHTASHDVPPDAEGTWKRVYNIGIGAVSGGGGSPSRVSKPTS